MKDPKVEEKQIKQKRDIKILIGLAVVAFGLIIVSLMVALNTDDSDKPLNPNDNKKPIEEVPNATKDDEEPTEEPTDEPTKDTTEKPSEETVDVPTKNENQKPVEPSKTYTNERMKITYVIPQSWKNLVEVSEDKSVIEFLYQGETLFLSLRAVTQGEYNENKEYFDSFYKLVLKNDNVLVLYALPNEHPLANEEGSAAFLELNAVMSDNYNLIKTVKAK